MKAIEYYNRLVEQEKTDGFDKAVVDLGVDLCNETLELAKSRCKSDPCVAGVLNEQNRKFRAIAKLEPRIKSDKFLVLLCGVQPQWGDIIAGLRLKNCHIDP